MPRHIGRRRILQNLPPFSPYSQSFESGSGNLIVPLDAGGPTGPGSATFEVVGGGSGGARVLSQGNAHSGSGGGYALRTVTLVAADSTKTLAYVVGAAGVGKTDTNGAGGAGGSSTLNLTNLFNGGGLTMTGGGAAGPTTTADGVPGNGTNGTTNTSGAYPISTTIGGTSGSGAAGGFAPNPGSSPGGGGGGGYYSSADGVQYNGTDGGSGLIKVTWNA